MYELIIGFLKKRKIHFSINVDLSRVSSVRIGPVAPLVTYPSTNSELQDLMGYLKRMGVKYLVIGRLSNTLIFGDVYDGIVISIRLIAVKALDGSILTVGAGASLASALSFAAREGVGGAEQLWLIPGSVGASVAGNAGAHGIEICDLLISALVLDSSSGLIRKISRSELAPAYRHTSIKDREIIVLEAELQLYPRSCAEIKDTLSEYKLLRKEKQPINMPSLGSVFKRVDGIGAGYYIEKAGLKGLTVGNVMVSDKHAGFIVNLGGATAEEYLHMVEYVKYTVSDRLGISLTEEIKIIK